MCLLVGRGDQGCICVPAPSKEGGRMGCWGRAGPHSSQGNDVGRNRLSDLQTAVCSESLLIPGPRERLEPAGEGLLWGDRGEVWRGTYRDRLLSQAFLCRTRALCPTPHLCPPSFLASHAHCRSNINSYRTSLCATQKGASVQNPTH